MKKTKLNKFIKKMFIFEAIWAVCLLGLWGYGAWKNSQPKEPFSASYTISSIDGKVTAHKN